jgi:hypothetical protein
VSFGLQSFDASGNLIFDSTTAVGGVVADYRTYGPSESATLTYPSFPGATAFLVFLYPNTTTVTLDSSLGYPRVTVSSGADGPRRFLLFVY